MNTHQVCLIVGETQQDLEVSKDGFIGKQSTVAYKKMYAKWQAQLLQGKSVSIEYTTNKCLNNQ